MNVSTTSSPSVIDRAALISWYRRNRTRSQAIFDLISDEAYYAQPIDLRHPIVFYEGHLPGFSFNTLVKRALGGVSIDAALESLFARGIDPHENDATRAAFRWPDRTTVRQFAAEADRRVIETLEREELDRSGHPLLDRAEAAFAILEHEAMHQETLLYMWHRLPFAQKHRPRDYQPVIAGAVPRQEWIVIPAGRATLGVDRGQLPFGWDNEFPAYAEDVRAFEIDRHDVTNAQYLEFVEAGGYRDRRWWRDEDWLWVQKEGIAHPLFWERDGERSEDRSLPGAGRLPATGGPESLHDSWSWRGMFDSIPLPLAWPVYVSHAEASAFARWRGARLPTEAEFQRAAYGSDHERAPGSALGTADPGHAALDPDGPHPLFGVDDPRGVFDFASWDPMPAGSHPSGRSPWGVDDLVGNGWEWTSTVFGPFGGFRASASYPEYSADFFDGEHFVMKGASPATARELIRPTFRNWFRPRYPYVYATFRCARDLR